MLGLNRITSSATRKPPAAGGRRRDGELVAEIHLAAGSLRSLTTPQLRAASDDIRVKADGRDPHSRAVLTQAFALIYEALRRTQGIELYDVQLHAALALAGGNVAEMQTGEGKTYSSAPAAYLHALSGRGVHLITPNPYLASRDCELLRPAFEALGMSVGLLPERVPPAEKRAAYLCDITYGTGYEFGFDYLRDQLARKQTAGSSLGHTLLSRLRGGEGNEHETIQRGLAFAIIDEVDNVLLDDAGSPLILSNTPAAEAGDADAHRTARSLLAALVRDEHYLIDPSSETVQLTAAGVERIHAEDIAVPIHQLLRTWTEYLEQALRAELLMRRDVHYVVSDETIQIVDANTGRIFSDRTWQEGLHQAIEAKEGLLITSEKHALAQITKQRYFRLYDGLCGMTGTATGCEREFRHVYDLRITPIPLRVPSRREMLPMRCFVDHDAKWAAIADSVREAARGGRPVLVGTRSISDSERLTAMFASRGLDFQLLNGRQDAE